jgi:Ca2+-binding EF-hand superfamily protein
MRSTAPAIAVCLGLAACQPGLGINTAATPSPLRQEYISEFKKIDKTGKGRITIEEATAYYRARFAELDRNGDGMLDERELEAMVPIMNARSGKDLVSKLDRNSDNKISQAEFLVITNWLFELSSRANELSLGDVERGLPASTSSKRYDPEAISGPDRGGPWETNGGR